MSAPRHHPACVNGCIGTDAGCVRAAYEQGRTDEAEDLAWYLDNKAPRVMSSLMAWHQAKNRSKRTRAARNRQPRTP